MSLVEDNFPILYKRIHHTKFGLCIYHLFDEMARHEKPLFFSDEGEAWYAIPLNYLVATYGGSKPTWQSNITLAVSIGLLRKIKPDADSLHPTIKQIYADGKQNRKTPKNLYSIPTYTMELFANAEKALEAWIETGVSTAKVTKASVINAQGRKQANTIFRDSRFKAANKAVEAAHAIVNRIT